MRFSLKNQETTSFKKRYDIGYKLPSLILGDFSFMLLKSYNIEYIYLYNFRRSLKKYYKFKKSLTKKVWLFIHKNYPLTKKSKNSRMGKGKGSLSRYCSRTLKNHNLLEFIGFSINEVFFLKKLFCKKTNIPIIIKSSFFTRSSYKYTHDCFESLIFNKKYRN